MAKVKITTEQAIAINHLIGLLSSQSLSEKSKYILDRHGSWVAKTGSETDDKLVSLNTLDKADVLGLVFGDPFYIVDDKDTAIENLRSDLIDYVKDESLSTAELISKVDDRISKFKEEQDKD